MYEDIPMNEVELRIRAWLSPEAVKDFDDMYYCRVLGAGNNIRLIGKMYADLSATAKKSCWKASELIDRVEVINEYFIKKRGASSYAIIAAIRIMTGRIGGMRSSKLESVCDALDNAYKSYTSVSDVWNQKIRDNLWNVICHMEKVLLFDYSSTVNAVMEVAREHGKQLEVFIPEIRILDGGHGYVRNGVQMGHKVYYFPDAGIAQFVERADAAFIGAETILPNGSVANTVGSDVTAISCQYYRKPLYVPTQLIKLDPRGFDGFERRGLNEDASSYFGLQLEKELRDAADMSLLGLVTIPAQLVTAFVTEEGVVPANSMYQVARAYMDRMEKIL